MHFFLFLALPCFESRQAPTLLSLWGAEQFFSLNCHHFTEHITSLLAQVFMFNVQNQSGECDSLAEHGRKLLIEPLSPPSFWWANICRAPWHQRVILNRVFFCQKSWHSLPYLMLNTLYSSYLRVWLKSPVSLSRMDKLTKPLLNTIWHRHCVY